MAVVGDQKNPNTIHIYLFIYITSNMNILGSVVTMSLTMTLCMHEEIPVDEACRRLKRPGRMS